MLTPVNYYAQLEVGHNSQHEAGLTRAGTTPSGPTQKIVKLIVFRRNIVTYMTKPKHR